ncbi:MAG: hypothetical protein HUU60_12610 [Armatimonadetes bacterium]|nr:hypothetical protein [Armatimonadota bacterium]
MIFRQPEPLITLSAKGADVKDALHDLFAQAKREYAIEGNLNARIYANLEQRPFTVALQTLSHSAKFKWEVRDGVYRIFPEGAAPKRLSEQEVLNRKVNVLANKTEIRDVARQISQQSGVPVTVDKSAPSYRVSAEARGITVKQALAHLCQGAGLEHKWTGSGFTISQSAHAGAVSQPPIVVETSAAIKNRPPSPRTSPNIASTPEGAANCPKCREKLTKSWKWCPFCGHWVKPITDKMG